MIRVKMRHQSAKRDFHCAKSANAWPPSPLTHTHFFKFENHLWNNKYVIALIKGHDHPATHPTIDHPLGRYKGFEVKTIEILYASITPT